MGLPYPSLVNTSVAIASPLISGGEQCEIRHEFHGMRGNGGTKFVEGCAAKSVHGVFLFSVSVVGEPRCRPDEGCAGRHQ